MPGIGSVERWRTGKRPNTVAAGRPTNQLQGGMVMSMTRTAWVALGAALLMALSARNFQAAPAPASSVSKEMPAEEAASPAIDPAELANSPVLRVRDAANRSNSTNNLKQIAIAVHNYAATYDAALIGDIRGKDGKQLLSWRVAALPYLEQDDLCKQFKLDEPW